MTDKIVILMEQRRKNQNKSTKYKNTQRIIRREIKEREREFEAT